MLIIRSIIGSRIQVRVLHSIVSKKSSNGIKPIWSPDVTEHSFPRSIKTLEDS